jgi:hypothetical protein
MHGLNAQTFRRLEGKMPLRSTSMEFRMLEEDTMVFFWKIFGRILELPV